MVCMLGTRSDGRDLKTHLNELVARKLRRESRLAYTTLPEHRQALEHPTTRTLTTVVTSAAHVRLSRLLEGKTGRREADCRATGRAWRRKARGTREGERLSRRRRLLFSQRTTLEVLRWILRSLVASLTDLDAVLRKKLKVRRCRSEEGGSSAQKTIKRRRRFHSLVSRPPSPRPQKLPLSEQDI